jgi:hypothetical protein
VVHQPLTLETLDDTIAWIREHDATITAWWEEQRRFNKGTDHKTFQCQAFMQGEIKEIRRDIQGIRKTMYIAMGGALVLGSVASTIITFFLGNGGMG